MVIEKARLQVVEKARLQDVEKARLQVIEEARLQVIEKARMQDIEKAKLQDKEEKAKLLGYPLATSVYEYYFRSEEALYNFQKVKVTDKDIETYRREMGFTTLW